MENKLKRCNFDDEGEKELNGVGSFARQEVSRRCPSFLNDDQPQQQQCIGMMGRRDEMGC